MSDEPSLRAAEDALQCAQLTSDLAELDRLLHPDLTFVGPDGALTGKAEDLEVHRTGTMRLELSEPEELLVRINDGVGVTVLTARLKGSYLGQDFDRRMRYTRTWAHGADTGWRVVAAQAAFLPD
ncbi:MAG: nuclear transport factor 2 family protein [Actinomycetales bacterium]